MNKLSLTGKRDFALTTDALAFMQSSYAPFEELVKLGGDNYILSGCVVTGSSVSSGWLVLKGKLLPFSGGTIQTNVRIVETTETITVDIGSREQTTYHAEFGTSADSSKNVAWTSITRGQVNINNNRLTAIETLNWVQLSAPESENRIIDTSKAFICKTTSGEVKMKGYVDVTDTTGTGGVSAIFAALTIPLNYLPTRQTSFVLTFDNDGIASQNQHTCIIDPTYSNPGNIVFGSFTGKLFLDGASYFL